MRSDAVWGGFGRGSLKKVWGGSGRGLPKWFGGSGRGKLERFRAVLRKSHPPSAVFYSTWRV